MKRKINRRQLLKNGFGVAAGLSLNKMILAEEVIKTSVNNKNSFEWLYNTKMASWWFTIEDLGWPDYEVEKKWHQRAKAFKKAGVNCVVTFGFHFRWDFVPLLDRLIAMLAKVVEICHDNGIRVVEHHSAALVFRPKTIEDRWEIRKKNNHGVSFYPDSWENVYYKGSEMAKWRHVRASTGKQPHFSTSYESFCPNNPDLQKAYEDMIKRYLEKVRFDALMSDDLDFSPDYDVCACEHCREKFYQATSSTLPNWEDKNFWGNKKNPLFLKWIDLRYQWSAQHYKRVRNFLPDNIALWGCASDCLTPWLVTVGFSAQRSFKHCDAVFREVYHKIQPNDKIGILAESAAFSSMAKQMNKPFITIFYVNKPEDKKAWFDIISESGSRPWVSKNVRVENAVEEEVILKDGYDFIDRTKEINSKPVIGIRFSQKYRDSLEKGAASKYHKKYIELFTKLRKQGCRVEVVFDEYVDLADTKSFKQYYDLKEYQG